MRTISARRILNVMNVLLRNLRYLPQSRFRSCGVCGRRSFFVSLSAGDERKLCVFCRANLRYEMLAEALRTVEGGLLGKVVVELDPASPLWRVLSGSGRYIRTYYSALDSAGTVRADGTQCEDVTKMSFADSSVDVIVSSDVLEHVPDVFQAVRESIRVLKSGGMHVFTVPTCGNMTKERAKLEEGTVKHLLPAEYHSDPLNPQGILAFWSFGTDLAEVMAAKGGEVVMLSGPRGTDNRIVWAIRKF